MKCFATSALPSILSSLLLVGSTLADSSTFGPFPNGVPGSGYGCENKCNSGDKNYVIYAKIRTYNMVNSGQVDTPQSLSPDGNDIAYMTRTFIGKPSASSPFCQNGYDGTTGPLGPCLSVNPGETMNVKIINKMDDGVDTFSQVPADASQFFSFIDSIPEGALPGLRASSPADLNVLNEEDMPGVHVSFDDTNLHVHGLHVVPHMFYPMGTNNPDADWITITPKSENKNTQCFCYVFKVPEDHPQGTFFWHIHRHGSAAMQGWQGMFGYLFVGDENNAGSPFKQLANQGVTHWEPLVFWEFQANVTNIFPSNKNVHTLAEGQYMEIFTHENEPDKQQFFYPVNNQFFPTFNQEVNEIVYYPMLNGQTSAGIGLYILDENDNLVPFYKFSSDGYMYGPDGQGNSVYQQDMLIVGPSQREGLLLQFTTPGNYRIMNHRIIPTQRNGAFPNGYSDQVTHLGATIIVAAGATTYVNPLTLDFTKGVSTVIDTENIVRHTTVTFDIDIQQDNAPFAQFEVNNKLYDTSDVDDIFEVTVAKAERWTVNSANLDVSHPFHIHVNPFQVDGIETDSVVGELQGVSIADTWESSNYSPIGMWRDTVFVPPKGSVDLVQQYGDGVVAFAGKTVFHCHYLEHEDQGMIKNLLIDSSPAVCVASQQKCFTSSDCCGYADVNPLARCSEKGKCCKNMGAPCFKDADCCNGGKSAVCSSRKCVKCKKRGKSCEANADCCSKSCNTSTKRCK
ncbi:hypothetical protein MPSEU_000617000 [Mayamaea pseudoterrestris]|nr:hypothetical protein MPSEU_000617000 [Mayamaea pseudoterrestris]